MINTGAGSGTASAFVIIIVKRADARAPDGVRELLNQSSFKTVLGNLPKLTGGDPYSKSCTDEWGLWDEEDDDWNEGGNAIELHVSWAK